MRQLSVGFDEVALLLHVPAQNDVGAATRHVGGDGDHLGPTGLGDDLGLAGMLLRVEHLVRELLFRQQTRDELRVLDRGRTHEHRLPFHLAGLDILDDGVVLLLSGAVDLVQAVFAHHRLVRRDDHHFQAVDLLELVRLGICRTRHAGELAVHAEVVLEGDRSERLVLVLDADAFLRLDRLVQAVGPASALHQAPGEFVDDDHFTVFDHVLDVFLVERVRP